MQIACCVTVARTWHLKQQQGFWDQTKLNLSRYTHISSHRFKKEPQHLGALKCDRNISQYDIQKEPVSVALRKGERTLQC